ncbi:MAG: family 1 encapsulin nanocompartment shell protein [Spirochaetaceae bacterium]
MNRFRRELAPITAQAWHEIETQARRFLVNAMSLRRVVDVSGPHGPALGAVPKGRLIVPDGQPDSTARVGVNRVQPLIEVRVPFELSLWELDNLERGATDIDLSPLETACWDLVRFEEETVFNGYGHADLESLAELAGQQPVSFGGDMANFLEAVAQASTQLHKSMVEGPYALIVPESIWRYLSSIIDGRPLRRHVEYLLDGPVIFSPFIPEAMLVSSRGGDLELVLGEDVTLGFENATNQTVKLYLTESFTFKVHDPSVMVFIR